MGFISYELRNRGGKATTIEEIMLVSYSSGIWGWLGYFDRLENTSKASRDTVELPTVLNPNAVWKGHSEIQERGLSLGADKESLIRSGKLFYKIRCTHSKKLLSGRVLQAATEMRI